MPLSLSTNPSQKMTKPVQNTSFKTPRSFFNSLLNHASPNKKHKESNLTIITLDQIDYLSNKTDCSQEVATEKLATAHIPPPPPPPSQHHFYHPFNFQPL